VEVVIFSKNEPALIVLVASLFGNDVLKNTGKNQFTRNKIRESYIIITLRHYKRSYTAVASKESLMLSIVLTSMPMAWVDFLPRLPFYLSSIKMLYGFIFFHTAIQVNDGEASLSNM
jgi:hypothetical protein